MFSLIFKRKIIKVLAFASKQKPIKEIDRKNKTFVNYTFVELLMIGFIKRYIKLEAKNNEKASGRIEEPIPRPPGL